MLITLRRIVQRGLYPKQLHISKMSQVGELGSGAGKGGGGGGSIREAGGSFGKMEAAREEEFFYKQQKEQLKNLKTKPNESSAKPSDSKNIERGKSNSKTNNKMANPLKVALRTKLKNEILTAISPESRARQSKAITEKVLQSEAFRSAQRVSIYLNTASEVDTSTLLTECFRLEKHVFVPTYQGNNMEMVRLKDMDDYETLPLTKWNIKQPSAKDGRENALTNGVGIDLFLMPGVGFTLSGGRMGHGMGYYDKFLNRHFNQYPNKKTTLMALAFKEQIVQEDELPLDAHDVRLHAVITE